MPKKAKNPIKQGSWVKVVIPKFVERVGYPRDIKYYETIIRARNGKEIQELITEYSNGSFFNYNDHRDVKAFDEILQTLAWRYGHNNRWGGPERSIHFIEKPEWLNREGWAMNFKRCVTGTYSPGYRSGGYEYDEWNPPYLYNQKHHRLVELCNAPDGLWIPDYHLELIK